MKLAALLLLVTSACMGGRGVPFPEPARAGDRNAKVVEYVAVLASRLAWERSAYWRLEDMGWPVQVVLAKDGTACPLWSLVVNEPRHLDYFACPTQWRLPRAR